MLNNTDTTLKQLSRLGLTRDEAKVYLVVLEGPASHLEIARKTGINRTTVYRIADDLEKMSLITHENQDSGRFLRANDPKNLEINLVSKEEHLKAQRSIFDQVIPDLAELFSCGTPNNLRFAIKTYDGISGFKQMLWNELEAHNELLIFGNGAIEDLVVSRLWAEKHRERSTESGYTIRELINPGKKPADFTKNTKFLEEHFVQRNIDPTIMPITQQMSIYNDTVATYHWKDEQKVGFEVVNEAYANTIRAVFENYWKIAE